MPTHELSISLNPRIRYREIGGDGVLVNLDSGRVIVITETGLRIVQSLETPKTKDQLTKMLTEEFETTELQAKSDIDVFLYELDKEQILGNNN